ncbi:DNA-3-methyladenine glycosylase family protein [Paraflavitalea pollutisoli]|uniref:DNA-3-methyladenine glycosylase family protein n=1 Tax=Paraflavitalea pollutisoli TaxID=3034143 RepID=UPI0023ED2741|nr:DNA glycosylase [Paraflavitalea sp. H1-2-19X]
MKRILIPRPNLFSFDECLWFLNRNYDDCLHVIEPGKIHKAICINGQNIAFTLQADERHLLLHLGDQQLSPQQEQALERYISDWFDLDRDITPFYKLLAKHKQLAYMATDYAGFRLIGIHDLFEALCWSIIGQQINLTFAYILKRRLVEQYGTPISFNDHTLHIFPAPEVLQSVSMEALRALQFSTRKAEYLLSIASLFAAGTLSKERLQQCSSYNEQVAQLTAVRGIGVWTANYAIMKSLKQLQAIPMGDVGLLNALTNHQLIKDRQDHTRIDKLFKQFKGWESYLVFYLWRSLSHA